MIFTILFLLTSWLPSVVQGFAAVDHPTRRLDNNGRRIACSTTTSESKPTWVKEFSLKMSSSSVSTTTTSTTKTEDTTQQATVATQDRATASLDDQEEESPHHIKHFMQYVGMNHVPKENHNNKDDDANNEQQKQQAEAELHERHKKQGHIVASAATGFLLAAEAGASAPVSAVAGAALMAYMAANGGDSLMEALPPHLREQVSEWMASFHSPPKEQGGDQSINHVGESTTTVMNNEDEAQASENPAKSLETTLKDFPEGATEQEAAPMTSLQEETPDIDMPKSSFASVTASHLQDDANDNGMMEEATVGVDMDANDEMNPNDDQEENDLVVGSPAWVAAQTRIRDAQRRHAQVAILSRGVLEPWNTATRPNYSDNNSQNRRGSFAWWD